MRKFIYLIVTLFLLSVPGTAQCASYFKRVFIDAEYYLLYEDYRDALPLYHELLNKYPNNANIHYRVGLCYLNIPGEKERSISYFQKAKQSITKDYKVGHFTEDKAPREVYLHYGRALRIAEKFEEAGIAFQKYAHLLTDSDTKEKEIVAKEIQAIQLAKQMKQNAIPVKFTSLGGAVNTRFPDINPLVSADTSILLFTSIQKFYNALMVSVKRAGIWSYPENINSQTYADGEIYTVGLSSDGKSLLLARNDYDVFNLYISVYDTTKQQWGAITRLPKEINSRSWENYASYSPMGDTLFFSSNRPGGHGKFDIYYSVKSEDGWSKPVNLSTINSPFDEIAPTISHDGQYLFFSSNGNSSMGGFDHFVSKREGSKWGKPINLGAPINTPDDDIFYQPIGNGSSGYISRVMEQSYGFNDMYLIEFNLDSLVDAHRFEVHDFSDGKSIKDSSSANSSDN
ncbi:MAG: hypothetical protein RBR13_02830 [Tenuifilaceae bacterium]|nr:hypothetical protein [Tenuifilaceae bacterium]